MRKLLYSGSPYARRVRVILTAIESMADALMGVRILLAGGNADAPYVARQRCRITSCLDWLEERIAPLGFWPEVFSVMDLNLICALVWGEKRGAIDYRTGHWPKIVSMIERWQLRPSLLDTPLNEPPMAVSAPNATLA